MIKCVGSKSLQRAASFDELLKQATRAGFAGLELDFGTDQPISLEQFGETGPSAFEKAKDWGLQICSVKNSKYDVFSLGVSEAQVRDAAHEYFKNLIILAAEVGRGVQVVITAHETTPLGARLEGSYEQTFNLVFESLEILGGWADRQAVYLAIENPGSGFLLSPLELRGMIDEINNPYLGVCFNPHYAKRLGDSLDWLNILNRRVISVRLPVEQPTSEETDNRYQLLLAELSKRHFSGPLIYTDQE
jgi:L-ribulose-5-phosphate 3-epimerase